MSNAFVALLLGVGVGAWVYSKAMRQTGDNTQSSLVAAAGVGLLAFILMLFVLSMVPR